MSDTHPIRESMRLIGRALLHGQSLTADELRKLIPQPPTGAFYKAINGLQNLNILLRDDATGKLTLAPDILAQHTETEAVPQ